MDPRKLEREVLILQRCNLETLALIRAWVGEPDAAVDGLVGLKNLPSGPDYGQLRYDPAWGVLRGRPDFQAMLGQMEPRMDL